MAFDFKKEYKEFYMPKNKPEIVNVPTANYIAVRGKGDPNEEGGAYQQAISVLYAVAYTLKMSYKTDYKIEGFFEYVVPPLEGFWWQENMDGVDYQSDTATARGFHSSGPPHRSSRPPYCRGSHPAYSRSSPDAPPPVWNRARCGYTPHQ